MHWHTPYPRPIAAAWRPPQRSAGPGLLRRGHARCRAASPAALDSPGTDTDGTGTGPALKDSSPSRDLDLLAGEVVSSQTIPSRSRTVETTTYSLENEGNTETRVEQKVTIQSDGDPIDHDEALAQAIQEATAMNPDMTVEKIEIHQTAQLSEQ